MIAPQEQTFKYLQSVLSHVNENFCEFYIALAETREKCMPNRLYMDVLNNFPFGQFVIFNRMSIYHQLAPK